MTEREAFEQLARDWKADAERRSRVSKLDPIADTLTYCANRITAELKALETVEQRLTVDEYAKRERVTPQTVRNWIRNNRLPAIETTKGYLISPDSRAVRAPIPAGFERKGE